MNKSSVIDAHSLFDIGPLLCVPSTAEDPHAEGKKCHEHSNLVTVVVWQDSFHPGFYTNIGKVIKDFDFIRMKYKAIEF